MMANLSHLHQAEHNYDVHIDQFELPSLNGSVGLMDWQMAVIRTDRDVVVALGFREKGFGQRRLLIISPAIQSIDMATKTMRTECGRHFHLIGKPLNDPNIVHLCEFEGYGDVHLISLMQAATDFQLPYTALAN